MNRKLNIPKKKNNKRNKEDICAQVLAGMRKGLSASKSCESAGIPQSTFNLWVNRDAGLAAEYARAREDLIELIANEVMELSDADVGLQPDGRKDWAAVQKQRLQVDTRKWLLSKLAPKKYGDKLELTGDPDRPLAIQKIERVVVGK